MTIVRRHAAAAVAALALSSASAAHSQDAAAIERGKAKFEHSCAPCHGSGPGDDGREMLPGTHALQLKYRGTVPPVLEHRTDLTAPVLRTFVRQGTFSMPPFRKTELTDAEIEDIAAYIAQSSRAKTSTPR
jgi:mono/diheme cytochrome c family protein